LIELAQAVAVSPHHLSRIFHAETGETLSRYRNRLRVRVALERLADGEERLTRLAAELGFADHAHLTRVVRDEVGTTPSALRAALVRQPPASAAN
jgi:AraC-like DNA-binding protein